MSDKIPDRSTLNEEDFKAMMERIEASNAGQEKYAKKQYRMSQITALCSILVLIIVIYAAVTLIPEGQYHIPESEPDHGGFRHHHLRPGRS